MGLKKKTKVSAEFSMSSLTDIIFLLLIFFMLTSSLVAPNALNLKLPGTSRSSKVADPSKLDNVRITRKGNYYLNNKSIGIVDLESALRRRTSASFRENEPHHCARSRHSDRTCGRRYGHCHAIKHQWNTRD